MIKRILLAATLLLSGNLYAAISGTARASPQTDNCNSGDWGGASCQVNISGTTGFAANDLLVAVWSRNNDASGNTPVLPSEGGWTQGPWYGDGSPGAHSCAVAWKKASGSETTVTPSWSNTSESGKLLVMVIPGTDLNLDALGDSGEDEAYVASATTSITSGSASNSTATGLAIAAFCTDNDVDQTGPPTYTNSFTAQATSLTGAYAKAWAATKVLSSAAAQTTTATIVSDQAYGAILVFNASGATCPATCAGGRSARCITDISDASDADNILYGLSPAAVANEDTVCYDPSSVLGDTVNVSTAGWPSIASGGSQLTDSFTFTVNDNGTGEGDPGRYEVTFQPVITSVTGIGTGQTTGTVTVTPAGPTEGTVRGVAISKTSYDTYGPPDHDQIAAGVDANDANVAWGSEFTKSFLSTVSPGWTFGRASSQTYEKSDGTLGTVTSGNPAFTYSGGTAQGVLLEGQRIALNGYGSDPRSWSNSTTRTNYTTTELGVFALGSREASAGEEWHRVYAAVNLTAGTAYAITFYYMAGTSGKASITMEYGANISEYKGTIGSLAQTSNAAIPVTNASHTDMGGGVWRTQFIATPTATASHKIAISPYSTTVGEDIIFLGAQIEAGAFPSSFVLNTTSGSATRVATSLTRSWTFDPNDFSGYIEAYPGFASTETGATNPVFSAYKDANNYLTITHPTTSGRMDLNLAIGGTTATAQVTGLTWAAGDKLDIRFRKNASGIKLWVEAGSTETTTGVAPNAFTTPPDTVRLGRDESSNYGFWTVGNIQLWNSVDDTALGDLVIEMLPVWDATDNAIAGSVADEIRTEATRPNHDSNGYALPLLSHWTTGKHALSSGWAPDWQLGLIAQGHYLLPWFELPGKTLDTYPYSAEDFTGYYEDAIKAAAALNLPLVFVGSQWERFLSQTPYLELATALNPNVVLGDDTVLAKVSPFGAVAPWTEIGEATTDTSWMSQIADWYPSPPLVIFLSNNEHAKLEWTDAETDKRYVAAYGTGTSAELKKEKTAEGWITRYRALQSGMSTGLPSEAWRSVAEYVGYDADGPRSFGRWSGWEEYALHTSEYVSPYPLMWDGGSSSFYVDNWNSITDFTVFSPQIEFMNLVFMHEEAWTLNPSFWYEMSVWDGHMPDDPVTDKREYYESLGQSYSPARYGGMVRFGMWLTRPRAVREFRDWAYPREDGNDYFMSLVAAVDEVHKRATLRDWWQTGEIVTNPTGEHPYQSEIPVADADADRWFLLDTDVTPEMPWTLSTMLPVYALALTRVVDNHHEWLVYAHAPIGAQTAVAITVPGYGILRIDVPVEGVFYQITTRPE